MNDTDIKLHSLQIEILKKLVKTTGVRFNDLLIEGLESEHMNYHLKKLMGYDFVEKAGNTYKLSDSGKNYSNLLDDQVEVIERQPKSSILLHAVRKNKETGEVEHLLSKRLRQPYLGKIGRLTGKIRFGETLKQAAERELYEETGLKARDFVLEEVYHKMRCKKDGTFVQDTLFYVFFVTDFYGSFIEKTNFQENKWWSQKDLDTQKDLNTYRGMKLAKRLKPRKLSFSESIGEAEGY